MWSLLIGLRFDFLWARLCSGRLRWPYAVRPDEYVPVSSLPRSWTFSITSLFSFLSPFYSSLLFSSDNGASGTLPHNCQHGLFFLSSNFHCCRQLLVLGHSWVRTQSTPQDLNEVTDTEDIPANNNEDICVFQGFGQQSCQRLKLTWQQVIECLRVWGCRVCVWINLCVCSPSCLFNWQSVRLCGLTFTKIPETRSFILRVQLSTNIPKTKLSIHPVWGNPCVIRIRIIYRTRCCTQPFVSFAHLWKSTVLYFAGRNTINKILVMLL